MSKLKGRFYLKQTSNGNFFGEFSNDKKVFTESADVKGKNKGFIGEYYSTWRDGEESKFAELTIEYEPDTDDKIFTLTWESNKENDNNYVGKGMLCDNILIGDYEESKKTKS